MTTDKRLNHHNATVDRSLARLDLCGTIHLATGRRCRLPARHAGGCDFAAAPPAAAPPGLSLDVRVDVDRHDVTAVVHGTVDPANVNEFHSQVGDLLGVGAAHVTVDLEHADLSDPSGSAALADLRQLAAHNDVEMHVVSASHTPHPAIRAEKGTEIAR